MIIEHPTWWKHHATKIQDYLTCPRYYFYRTILGWKREATHNHLAFGSAWHEMQEALLQHGYNTEALVIGMERFLATYRQHFTEETDELFTPKTPANALTAAAHYIQEYMAKDASQEVLHTEACGAILVSPSRVIRFKMDSILQDDRGIFSREHKTGSRGGRQWVDQWVLSMQVGTYTHALYSLYPADEVWGVEISGTIFQKPKIDFIRVPCRASLPMLNAWLADVNRWIGRIEEDIDRLLGTDRGEHDVMTAFPRNPTACTDYYGCEYHPFCMSWPNPLTQIDVLPIGFFQEYWDPEAETEDKDLVQGKENLGVLS
jgi:hypothetical protein